MSKQEFYRQQYKKINPQWNDSLKLYINLIDREVTAKTKVLDIGCGHGDFLKAVFARTEHTYGIDSDGQALKKNTIIKNKINGSAEQMPLPNNFFDLVVSSWAFEHLENPRRVLTEIYRILKPGGKIIFLTPNSWNYVVWINRLIPRLFRDFLTQKLYNRQEHDTFPTRYKINSVKKIDKRFASLGFKKSQLILNGDPSYISFNQMLFKLACFIEKILDIKLLNFAKVHIIGVYKK